jgi:hypothetical protein
MLHLWSVDAARPCARVPAIITAACTIAVGGTTFAGPLQPSASVTTLTPDWGQKFTIDWTVECRRITNVRFGPLAPLNRAARSGDRAE